MPGGRPGRAGAGWGTACPASRRSTTARNRRSMNATVSLSRPRRSSAAARRAAAGRRRRPSGAGRTRTSSIGGPAGRGGERVDVHGGRGAALRSRRRRGRGAQGGRQTTGDGRTGRRHGGAVGAVVVRSGRARRRRARCAAEENRPRWSARSGCSITSATGPSGARTSRRAGPSTPSRRDRLLRDPALPQRPGGQQTEGQAAEAVGGLLVGAGEPTCLPRQQLLVDDAGRRPDPGDGAGPVVRPQLVAPAWFGRAGRRRWLHRPGLAVVGQTQDGMRGVPERRRQALTSARTSGGTGPAAGADSEDERTADGHRRPRSGSGRTRRRRRRGRGPPGGAASGRRSRRSPHRPWCGTSSGDRRGARSARRPASATPASPAAVNAGTMTATWSRSRQERPRRDEPGEPAAARRPRRGRPAAEEASGWASSTDGWSRDGGAGDLDLVGRADQQHDPRAQRLALGQGDAVAPRQVRRGELGVHRLLDLDVARARRRDRCG